MKASCHCNNVTIEMAQMPASLTRCNCSFCHRVGALWGYFEPAQVEIKIGAIGTVAYCHGDMYIRFHHCPSCGCTTHYSTTEKSNKDKIAINFNMADAKEVKDIPVRLFDGAESFNYV